MDILKSFQAFISREQLFAPSDSLLIAVSGGLDSVVLCELCKNSGIHFTMAHANFLLRGEESNRDQNFVVELAKKYESEIFVKSFDTENYAKQNKLSIQTAARRLRYEWFYDLLLSHPSRGADLNPAFIATAHHQDDNLETMLMNFFRGTGISGLRGMLPKQDKIVRPLLFAKKEELRAFAEQRSLAWVEDSSNDTDKYTRNYFRQQLLPAIEKMYSGALNNLSGNMERFRDIELLYSQSISQHKKRLLEQKGTETQIAVLKLKKTQPLHSVCYEIIKDYGFSSSQTKEMISLLDSQSGKFIQSATHRILKHRNWLIISALDEDDSSTRLIEQGVSRVQSNRFSLQLAWLSNSGNPLAADPHVAYLDAARITFPLILRKWRKGDYFYPLGMRKKKKLARFFIDQKLSQIDKEKRWVIESEQKIIWVLGMRIDERFKVDCNTRQILKIEMRVF
jgi:tRNA(Ile)-lysidine synthase